MVGKWSGIAVSATWTDDKGWELAISIHGTNLNAVPFTHRYRYDGVASNELVDLIDVALDPLIGS